MMDNRKLSEEIPMTEKSRLDAFYNVLRMTADKGYVFLCDIAHDLSRWDERIVKNYALPSEYMYHAGAIWEKQIHPDDRETYRDHVEETFRGDRDEFELSYRVRQLNGKYYPCTCKGIVIRDLNGQPEYFGGVLRIQETYTRLAIPKERIQKLDSLFEAFSVIADDTLVYLCDMYYDYSRWSKGLVEEFDLPSEYMHEAGTVWEEHVHPIDRQAYHDGVNDVFQHRASGLDLQYRVRRADGQYDICSARGIVINDESGQPEYFGGMLRIHGLQNLLDTMTGLRNQYGFFEDISRHIQRRDKVRITVLGIGKLTEINEVYGYRFGNIVLQRFGSYLMDHAGIHNGIYRLDGSKFAVITKDTTDQTASEKYEEIKAHFREGMDVDGVYVTLELNAGTMLLDDFETDDRTVYACLNFAYDESKQMKHGKMVTFTAEFSARNRQRIEKLHAIRNSITKGYRGFYLLYQPIVDAETEEMIGAEALLRWKDETYGVVPPDEFISILEKDPLFPVLGEWILHTALKDAKKILRIKPDFVINVNLSYVQLEQPDFVDSVWNILKKTGFPPEHLCLEITERCRLLDMKLLENVTTALRAGGVRIALDDFGTGYSAIGLVKSLPLDSIKIDRSFVRKIEEGEKERQLIDNFTDIAGIYGAKVCVEGIETVGMRDILLPSGIHSFQGYYYSRPIEIEELFAKYCAESS